MTYWPLLHFAWHSPMPLSLRPHLMFNQECPLDSDDHSSPEKSVQIGPRPTLLPLWHTLQLALRGSRLSYVLVATKAVLLGSREGCIIADTVLDRFL